MLGIEGFGVFAAYVLSILSALLCAVYGIMNWNKPPEDQTKEMDEESAWEEKDDKIAKQL